MLPDLSGDDDTTGPTTNSNSYSDMKNINQSAKNAAANEKAGLNNF